MSAEYLAKKYCQENNIPLSIKSCGTRATPDSSYSFTLERLRYHNAYPYHHTQTKAVSDLFSPHDVIICMAMHHVDSITALGYDAVLFNSLAFEKNEDLLDEYERGERYGYNYSLQEFCYQTVDRIAEGIPFIIEKLKNYKSPKMDSMRDNERGSGRL